MKSMKIFLFLMCGSVILSTAVSAHKVNIFAYVESGTIYTESYFPDGRAVEKGNVLIYDSQDNLLLEGTTDQEGLCSFDVPKVDDLTVVIDASMGHRSSFELSKDEVEAGQ